MSTYPLFPDETKLASDRHLLAVLENISDAFIIFDTHWCYTYVNRAAETILQKKREDLLGKNVWEVYPEAVGTTVWTKYHEAVDTQTVVEFEDFYTPFLKWFHMRVYPSEEGLAVYFQDMTERKHAEEQEHFLAKVSKLLASTLDYQETLANIARLVVPQLADWFIVDLVNEHGQFELIEVDHRDPGKVQWAKELRKKYPVDPDAPTGAPNVARTGQAELYAEITDDMLIASARDEEELAITRQIGFTSVMIVPLVVRGKTLGAVTFVAAESGRRYNTADVALAEEVGRRVGVALDNAILYRQVQQSRDQLDVILRGIADGITVQDVNGTVIYTNDIAAHLSGFPSAEVMLSMPPATLMQALSRFVMKDEAGLPLTFEQLPGRRALQGEKNVQAIIQYYDTVTGQTLWSLVKAEPLFNEHGGVQFAVNVFVDLTERKELELRKDEFISMASHELKTPVTSLKGFTQVLYRRFKKRGEEEPLSFLARMDGQLNKLTKLINDLLDLSKIQTGKLTVQEEAFDLADVVGDIVDTLQATLQTHQLALTVHLYCSHFDRGIEK